MVLDIVVLCPGTLLCGGGGVCELCDHCHLGGLRDLYSGSVDFLEELCKFGVVALKIDKNCVSLVLSP